MSEELEAALVRMRRVIWSSDADTLDADLAALRGELAALKANLTAELRAQLVSCEGQWRKEVDANTVTRAQLADAREGFEKMRLLCRRDLHPNPADVELLVDNLARKMLGPFGHTEQVCQRAPHYGSCKALPAPAAEGEKPGNKEKSE